jgi:hypothetical protein
VRQRNRKPSQPRWSNTDLNKEFPFIAVFPYFFVIPSRDALLNPMQYLRSMLERFMPCSFLPVLFRPSADNPACLCDDICGREWRTLALKPRYCCAPHQA